MSVAQEMILMLPEIVLVVGACFVLLCPRFLAWPLTMLVLAGTVGAIVATAPEDPTLLMTGMFERSSEIDLLRILICVLTVLILRYARGHPISPDRLQSNEFYTLAIFGCVGMFLISGAEHLITLYLGLEILALSLYPMIAMVRDDGRAGEVALKYFVLGALASGFLLYGMSLMYAVTGTLHIGELASQLEQLEMNRVLLLGMVFMLAGLAFKLGATPFHMWLPDVYDGASIPAVTYLSAAPKIAGLLLLLRLFSDGLMALAVDWTTLMMVLAVLSLLLGNLVAIAQTRIRRMLAYSAIAHTGFVFLALGTGTPHGMSSAVFYTFVYALMAAGSFGMLLLLNARTAAEDIQDFKGLNHSHPWLAIMVLILMFSMAGVPLTAGFYAKLYVLQAVVDAGLWPLAVVAVLLTVVGAYYYLRIVWYMYFEEADRPAEPGKDSAHVFLVSANALILVFIFAVPQPWLEMSRDVARVFVGGQ